MSTDSEKAANAFKTFLASQEEISSKVKHRLGETVERVPINVAEKLVAESDPVSVTFISHNMVFLNVSTTRVPLYFLYMIVKQTLIVLSLFNINFRNLKSLQVQILVVKPYCN